MELQSALMICGIGVTVVAILLLVGLFSRAGTTYEEAVAQHRRATTELLALADPPNKTKKTKKANKKLAKKEKRESGHTNTGTVSTASEPESEVPADSGVEEESVQPQVKPHVEFCPPVVVDIIHDSLPNVKIRKRGKDPKVKPILINKEDPSCVSDPSTPPSPASSAVCNHFEETHPKDDFELLQSSLATEKVDKKDEVVEKKESKPIKATKSNKAVPKQTSTPAPSATPVFTPAPEPTKETVQRELHASVELPKEQRKGKKGDKKIVSDDVVETVRNEPVPPLNAPQPSELTTEKLLKQALATTAAAVPAAFASAVVASPAISASVPAASTVPPAQPTKSKKNKKAEANVLTLMAGDGGGINVSELVRLVSEAALSRTEIQILTDTLLNKQHDPLPQHSEWTEGPNDPIQKLKKQLADKEKALSDELEASRALHAKLKELRNTLNLERSRASGTARGLEETRAELHSVQALLQRQREETRAIDQDRMMLQSKLAAEAEGQAQRVQMEMHIQRLSESEASLIQQLNALQAELSARALEAGQVRCEVAAAREASLIAQQQLADMAQQLQEANRVYNELDSQRQSAIHAEQMAQQELHQAQERITALSELQGEVQRATSRAQVAEAKAEKLQEEIENQKQLLSNEINSLREQLALRESEIAELKQMKVAPPVAQNGLPPATTTDGEHKSAELAKVEGVIESLRTELAAARRDGGEQRDQLAHLQAQLDHYRDKNNELRTKNWKVMEALQSAEKALQAKSTSTMPAQELNEAVSAALQAQYREVAGVLRAACPAAAVTDQAPSRAWLDTFTDNLRKELNKVKVIEEKTSSSEVENERVVELRVQVDHLQGLVDKYKRIIDDTEGVLSRLQANVTAEEARWAQQLADKQRELDELRASTLTQEPLAFAFSCIEKSLPNIIAEMQNKIESLEAELRQAQSHRHNHSFADAERLTEENSRLTATALLTTDLKDKLVLDSFNGPLQVDLDDK